MSRPERVKAWLRTTSGLLTALTVAAVVLGMLIVVSLQLVFASDRADQGDAASDRSRQDGREAVEFLPPEDPDDEVYVETLVDTPLEEIPDRKWVTEMAFASGIPERALTAYSGAAILVAEEMPDCRLDWATLAGIGQVESQHGQLAGGMINAQSGQQEPELFGVQLNGASTRLITDTDNGELDGDRDFDRAMGPMQFIPGTWKDFAADGNLDGREDPQQIDDAALAAGRYLCATGGKLSEAQNWIDAVSAYNETVDYNNRVAYWVDIYRAVRIIEEDTLQ